MVTQRLLPIPPYLSCADVPGRNVELRLTHRRDSAKTGEQVGSLGNELDGLRVAILQSRRPSAKIFEYLQPMTRLGDEVPSKALSRSLCLEKAAPHAKSCEVLPEGHHLVYQ